MKPAGRVVSVFGVNPSRLGGGEVFARAPAWKRLAARVLNLPPGANFAGALRVGRGGEAPPRVHGAERKFDLAGNLDPLMHAYGFE